MRKLLPILGLLAVQMCAPFAMRAQQPPVGVLFPTGPKGQSIAVPNATIIVGQSYTFTASVQMSDGSQNIPLSSSSCTPWLSANPSVATINQLGTALGVSAGTSAISCVDGSFAGTGLLTVVPLPLITNPVCGLPPCALPNGNNGSAYSFTFTAAQGVPPYTWSVSLGSLPGWASLNASTGALTGTAATGTTSFTIQVCDANSDCGTLAVTLTVAASLSCEPPNYCAYTGEALVLWPAVPNMGGVLKNGAVVTDTSYPSGTPGNVTRCSDQALEPSTTYANQSKSAGLGGSGDAEQLFNANSTILHINLSGGLGHLVAFNPSTLACGDSATGYVVTSDKNLSNPGPTCPGASCAAYAFGNGSFDWTNPNTWYSFASGADASGLTVAKYTFNSSHQFTVAPNYMDLEYGLPIGSLVSAWQPNTAYTSGQYVSYTLNSTQAPDWLPSHAYNAGDVILPKLNNTYNCGIKYTQAGISGASEPNWNSGSSGACTATSNGQITDGTAKARNLGGPPIFVFQLVSASGTSGTFNPFGGTNYPDLDDFHLGTPGWQAPCYYPSCNPGGNGTPTGVNQTFTTASPSLDGNSMMMTETGTDYSNVMFHYAFGADNSATSFTGTYSVYIQTSLAPWQVFGMDMYQYIPGVRLMWGSQCALAGSTAGFWSFFNQGSGTNGTWIESTVPCPIAAPNTWVGPISLTVHRVPGDTSCIPGGVPAEHYDSITQNGTTYPLNLSYCSETTTFGNDTGMQFDVSGSEAGGTLTAYVDLQGQSQGLQAPIVHPDFLATYSDNGLTWENVGPDVFPEWTSFAGISSGSNRLCSAFSNNTYGNAALGYNQENGDQGTGIYSACYDASVNQFELINTATGYQSKVTCVGGTGYNCAGGTWSMAPQGAVTAITSGCPFLIHNDKGGSTLDYVTIARQQTLSGSCSNQDLFSWQPFAAFNSTTSLQLLNGRSDHWTIGHSHLLNVGDTTVVGSANGTYDVLFNLTAPSVGNVTTWQVSPCGGTNPPCSYPAYYDSHMAWWHDPLDDDLGPICGTIYNVATLAPPPVEPWQGEEACVTATPSWTSGVGPIGNWDVWRFTHNFNTGGNSFFDTQFAISQLSNDGRFLAFSSDWNCTLGTTSGTTSPLYCGPPWVGGTVYANGQMINPFSSTGGSGTNYGVYEITAGGTASATKPAWFVCNSGTAGNTVTDSNGVIYTCLGTSNGKGEVFIVQLAP